MNKIIGEEYIEFINKKCMNLLPQDILNKKASLQEKINDYDLVIPTKENIDILFQYNYNKEQLKKFAKQYKLKMSGNKKELIVRLYCFLTLSIHIIKIQKCFRGNLIRKYNKSHGPALFNRSLCTNNTDFFTMDEIQTLPYTQFFSYQDKDGFIYGFDIISLYTLLKTTEKNIDELKNPYNRNIIPNHVLSQIKLLIKLSRILKKPIQIDIKEEPNQISPQKLIELRILSLFKNIDDLGNYSTPVWFTTLNRNLLLKFLRELTDILNYSAQISNETKRAICPTNGEPFININLNQIYGEPNLDNIKYVILEILEKFVNSGINNDSKTLGSYYVLGALTLVNDNASLSLPWLYQSFSYI